MNVYKRVAQGILIEKCCKIQEADAENPLAVAHGNRSPNSTVICRGDWSVLKHGQVETVTISFEVKTQIYEFIQELSHTVI